MTNLRGGTGQAAVISANDQSEVSSDTGAGKVERRPCPVCDSRKSRLLFKQSFEQISGVQLLNGYDVVICSDCGAAFADQLPSQAVFDAYYHSLSKYEFEHRGGRISDYDDLRFREIARSASEYIPHKHSRILEIGCATGHLLGLLKASGYESVSGVDPSPGCAKVASELYGITVRTHSLFDIPRLTPSADMVILIGVMEHIRDLEAAVAKLRQLLTADGRVYVAVPDATHFAAQKDAPFQEFSPEHLNFFSITSLSNLMRRGGFLAVGDGRFSLEQSRGTRCSSLFGVFKKTEAQQAPPQRDVETENALVNYLRKSEAVQTRIKMTIEQLAASGRGLLVWGTGAHTQRLLTECGLGAVNITAFVDSNRKYEGQKLHGIPILTPGVIHNRTEPILVSSYAAQHDIVRQIREELTLQNELILLYDID